MDYSILKNQETKFKVVADFDDVTNFNATTLVLKVTSGMVDDNVALVTTAAADMLEYTFGYRPLLVSITAMSGTDPKFEVVLKNNDKDNNINLSGFSLRTQVTAGGDYT